MNQLKASIIVAMYNGEATVEKTLNSILAQAYENYEIIIVDDGSKNLKHLDFISNHFLKNKISLYKEKEL